MQLPAARRTIFASFVLALVVAGSALLAAPAASMPWGPVDDGVVTTDLDLYDLAVGRPATKIEVGLLEIALEADPDRSEYVVIVSADKLDLDRYSDFVHQFTWPAGEHVAVTRLAADVIEDVAALPGVIAVNWGDPVAAAEPPFDEPQSAPLQDIAFLRERLDAAPRWSDTAAALAEQDENESAFAPLARDTAGSRPDGWFDVEEGHAAREAWELGYTGEGVTVAVLDYAIDFAHQDLQGTWKVLPEAHPYGGWVQTFDPLAGYQRTLDADREEDAVSTRTALTGMIEMYQSSPVEEREIDGEMKDTACFQPLYNLGGADTRVLGDEVCDYVVPESQSGEVRFGHHPDAVLQSLGADTDAGRAGEWLGVLLVDSSAEGAYDTVFVDLNADHDFTDEKPVTKEDPLAWRDINEDEVADLSGGVLYWISDGELPFPAGWLWGIEEEVPDAGMIIGLQGPYEGRHGTMCGSNVISQGRLGVPDGTELKFRDLPDDGQPPSTNLGMAPESKMVTIGSVYAGGRAMFDVGWRYAATGHDLERQDDQIQTASNSYGFSDVDHDGWDDSSRIIDYYINEWAPTLAMHYSTGNGGPGYGTLAPPSPSTGFGIAASTQMGSTGTDSITETTQITFGDIIPFSNRGPGADGRIGPTIAADGAYASGAIPINSVTLGGRDGSYANTTWGGTSRSGPVANGGMALVYDAFYSANERWPTVEEARSILMAGARYTGYDTFVAGGGVLDAADSSRIAGGDHGVYVMPGEWTAGDFRGERYDAFAKIMSPGDESEMEFTVRNPAAEDIEVTLTGQTVRRIGHYTDTLTTDRLKESQPSPVMDYLVPIDKEQIPEGTELMIVRGIYPMAEFDADANSAPDNYYTSGVIQHTDINENGSFWNDENGNGVIDHKAMTDSYVNFAWDDQELEVSSLEGGITVPLEPDGIEAEIAWYGRACNDDDRFQDVSEKIALIERGECTFAEKILNAQNDGAIAAVLFTDDRAWVSMGGDSAGILISGVMINRPPGLDIKQLLEDGKVVTAGIFPNDYIGKGLGGAAPVDYDDTEVEQYEYLRVTQDGSPRNNWTLSVHHPIERWADGLYISLWHTGRNAAITNTHMTFRLDFYQYDDWDWLGLSESKVIVPAGDEVKVSATMSVPEGAAYGAFPGAMFVDYARGEGDEPVSAPGGFELDHQRAIVPVNVNVAAPFDWESAVTFGGDSGNDLDAPYNNGSVFGTFNWNWRNESGDWRFFFIDALKPPVNSYFVFRTMWDDENTGLADIDTRVLGPREDSLSTPGEEGADPEWFGPYTLDWLTRSPYVYLGAGRFMFNTSSGEHDDWLAAPAGEGLHEVLLHNVLFSGTQIEMPFESIAGALQLSQDPVLIYGDECSTLTINSQLDLPDFQTSGFGMSLPEVFEDEEIKQDDPDVRETASFTHTLTLDFEAGRFEVTLEGQAEDDLDLHLLYDADGDGVFDYDTELVAESATETSSEFISVPGISPPGDYQVWVHGWSVPTETSTFDMIVDVVSGDTIQVNDVPENIVGGEPASLQVCADTEMLVGEDGPAYGLITFGPGGAPTLLGVDVEWRREKPKIYLPMTLKDFEFEGRPGPEPTGEPGEPTEEPGEPTEEPGEPTEEPGEPTEEPGEPTVTP